MGMGRTARQRKKPAPNFRRLDHEPQLACLNSWLARNGVTWNKKLGYAEFVDVGRGLVANSTLAPGELLVDLPLTLTINITTLILDQDFESIFTDCEVDHSVSTQSMLSFYLVYLKKIASNWQIYIESLPTEYMVPYFLTDWAKNNLESSIQQIVRAQENCVKVSFKTFQRILSSSDSSTAQMLHKVMTISDYEWAYFTVNTRCVYMDLSDIIDLKCVDSPILQLIKDSPTIALCPYLDMINHSANVKTQTKLIVKTSDVTTPLKVIKKSSLQTIRFHLYTMNKVKSFNELYICYGESHNLKLVTEYGFYSQSNEHDSVHFDFESIKSCLSSQNLKLSQDQCRFISIHNLSSGLYVDSSGPSFNLYALLTVLKFYNEDGNKISHVIYSEGVKSTSLNKFIQPLIKKRILEIEACIERVRNVQSVSINLKNCIDLMCRYVVILKSMEK